MLLKQLIDIVQNKINYSRNQTIELIYETLNSLPNEFSKDRLERTFEQEEPLTIVKEMQELQLIQLKYHYQCKNDDDTYTSKTLHAICDICENDIHDLNHEVNTIYSIKKTLYSQMLEECTNLLLDKYLKEFSNFGIESLKEQKQFIIPFYGAGLSIPLGFPSWGKMLADLGVHLAGPMRPAYESYIDGGDYLKALEYLKDYSMLNTESIITGEIIKNFKKNLQKMHLQIQITI